jgi:dTDP-glucose 4,6-dehydratase
MQKKRILVAGGSGFIGFGIVRRLCGAGHEVLTLNRGTRKGIHGPEVREAYADRHDPEALGKALSGLDFDQVIDVSAYTEMDAALFHEALKGRRIKTYLFISSSAVYTQSNRLPIKETFPTGYNRFWQEYGTGKVNAEQYLFRQFAETGFPAVCVRPPYIYGPGNNIYREAFVFDRAGEGKPVIIPGNGETPVQFIHIDDLADTLLGLLDAGDIAGEAFNAAYPGPVTLREWVEACFSATGLRPQILTFDSDAHGIPCRDFFPFHDYAYWLDTEKSASVFSPKKDLAAGLKETLAWYSSNPDLAINRRGYGANSDRILEKYFHWKAD